MTERRRDDDTLIDEIRIDVKSIMKLLKGNGDIGVCAQVKINETNIKEMKKKPFNTFNIIIGVVIILNMIVSAYAMLK